MTELVIALTTWPRDIRARRLAEPELTLALHPALSTEDLIEVCERYAGESNSVEVYELAVIHPSSNEDVVRAILRLAGSHAQIENAIVTSGRAPRGIISELGGSPHPSVREHAAIAALTMDLDAGLNSDLIRTVAEAGGDAGVGLRWAVARHLKTPTDVLEMLSEDEADVVADAAKHQLAARSGQTGRGA